ncbi:DNRLRE domain-containing protein [Saccharothrix saharensis]|uniref:DNRLRE domain-containing protein n=1 Tax=Saccharothrix saharensis TaxID=571190 RepID=UPI0036989FCF
MGTALAVVFVEQRDRREAAASVLPGHGPAQQWGDAQGAVDAQAVHKAEPRSLQSQFPEIEGQPEPGPPANEARVGEPAPREVRGFDAATSRELADRRTDRSRTFANSDGTLTTEVSQDPLHHRDRDGSWAAVDPTAVRDGDQWRNKSDSVDVRLANTADAAPLVRMSLGDKTSFGFSLKDAARSTGRAEGSRVTYPAVRPNVDLRLDLQSGGVKETLVLHSADTPRSFDFPLRLEGVTAKVVDGAIELVDAEGERRALVPAGHMEDSHDGPAGPAFSAGVRYELVGDVLRVHLDRDWLADPARRYPVLVDPTVTTLESPASMYVQRQSNNQNFSNAAGQELRVGTVQDGGVTIHTASYLAFPGVESSLAHHKVFGASLALTNFHSYSCNPRPVSVHPVTAPWTAGTGHTFPGPAYGAELDSASFAYGYIAPGATRSNCPQATAGIPLGAKGRDLVQRWVSGQQANYGLTVRASETDQYGWKKFYGHGTANKPRLFITHTPYDASYRFDRPTPQPPLLKGGQPGKVGITVTNHGATTWTPGEYVLSYRQFSANGAPMVQVNDSAVLPHEVPRGHSVSLEAAITPPADWGQYTFEFSMHRKGHAYFVDEQIPPAALVLEMKNVPPVLRAQYPPNGYSAPTLTPTLWANGLDIDNGGAGLQYRFVVCDKANTAACVDSGYQGSPSWTVPAGSLRWSKTYTWNAYVKDSGGAESAPVQASALLTAVPQPEVTAHLGNAPYSGKAGDVDAQVANYRTSAIDASVGSTGPPLTVTRTYNSLDPRRDLLFGAGWTSQFDMRAVQDQDGTGNVVITYPDGSQVRFGHHGDGTYAPPPGRYATLFRNADNGWTLVDKNATGYYFRADGRLARITDNALRAVELSHDTAGRLSQARSPVTGRYLTFTWTGAHVTSVSTNPVNGTTPTWRYTYDGDKLTKVCDPKNGCTTYDHTTGSHYRSAVLDSRPSSYWPLGDSGDKAGSQIGVNLGKDFGSYVDVQKGRPGALAGSADAAAGFDGVKSRITLPDHAISKNRNASVELWFRTTASGPLVAFQNKAFDQSGHTATVPVLYVGTDGKLRGQFWTDPRPTSPPITTTGAVNDGQWHHVVLAASVGSQTLYLDGAVVGERAGVVDDHDLTHGQLGAGISFSPANDWPAWSAQSKWYFQGDLDEAAVYAQPLGLNQVRAHHAARLAADQVAKVTLPTGRVAAELRYDTVQDRVSEYLDANGGTWKFGTPVITGNDTNLVRTVRVTDPGNRNHFYDFDPLRGRILRQLSPLGISTRPEDTPPDNTTPPTSPTTCAPVPGGNFCDVPIGGGGGFVDVEFQGVRTFGYDESGFQTTITDETGRQIVLAHDERGNVKSRKTCRGISNCQTAHYAYHLNPNDATDPRNDRLLEHRDARSSGPTDNRYRTSYTYNTRGDLVSQTTADSGVVSHTYTDGGEPGFDGGNQPPGLVKTSRDAEGGETRYSYYRTGDLAEVRAPSGLRTVHTYDALGRLLTTKVFSDAHPQGLTATHVYDELSRVVRVTEPPTVDAITGVTHTRRTTVDYDADGRQVRVEVSDLSGGDEARVNTVSYDAHGRVDRITDPLGGETSQGYDAFGNLTWTVNAKGVRHEFAYTARNAVSEVRLRGWNGDPEGAPASAHGYLVLRSNAYDGAGRLVRTTDAMQRTEVREYYDDDLLRSRKLLGYAPVGGAKPQIEVERNTYDAAGHLTEQRLAGGLVTTYEYDAVGRRTVSTADPTGLNRRTAVEYDRNGKVKRVTRTGNDSNTGSAGSSEAEVVDFTYDIAGRRTTESTRLGTSWLVTKYGYDQRGLITSVTSPRGNETGADPAAYTTSFSYDAASRLVGVQQPPVAVESGGGDPVVTRPESRTGYNAYGQVTANRDANGNVTRFEVDRLGRVVRTHSPTYTPPGQTTPITGTGEVAYDAVGNVVRTTDARGAVSTFRYDQLDRLVERTVPKADAPTESAGSWLYTYTRTGELLSTDDPSGGRSEATYDGFGRRITSSLLERHPSTTLTTDYAYDDAGRLIKATSPGRNAQTWEHDAVGQVVRSTTAAGVTTQYGYDMTDRLVRVSDALGRTSRSGYDNAGRLTSTRQLGASGTLIGRSTFAYDADGNPTTSTDPFNRQTTYTHDALGRLVRQVEPVADGQTITTGFGYDAAGHTTRFTDGRGNKTVYTVNSLGLNESVVEPATAAHPDAADRTWTTTYSPAGDPVSMRLPGGVTRARTFDALGRLTRETGAGAESATADRVLRYDVLGRLVGVQGVGGENTYTYNDRGALLTASGPGGESTRQYDADGMPTSRTDASGTTSITYDKGRPATVTDGLTGLTQTYGYNAADQVEKIAFGAGRERVFGYDDAGRLASDTVAGGQTTYGYDKKNRLTAKTTPSGANTYGYDFASRLTSWTSPAGTVAYEWDAAGNRTKAGDQSSTYDERNRLLTEGSQAYTHSARGTLAAKAGGETFSFDAFDRMTRQGAQDYAYDGLDRVATRNNQVFTYGGLSNELVADGTSTYSRGAGDQLLAIGRGDAERLTVSDRHGDLVATLDPAGPMTAPADTATFDPFGRAVATTGTKQSLGYQGDWTDPDTGQVNMTARWYNPGSGAFASRDDYPLSASPSGMANRYAYGLGSPLDYSDPSGHKPDDWCLGGPGVCGPRPGTWDPWDDLGDWFCMILPDLCGPPPPDAEPPADVATKPGFGNLPPNDMGRDSGSTNGNRSGSTNRGPSPTDIAREEARAFGRNNPLPVPEALTQPLYGTDSAPPVSSSPNLPSHQAGFYANPVGDVNNSYSAVYANLLEQAGSVIQNVSATLQSPTWLTQQSSSDCWAWTWVCEAGGIVTGLGSAAKESAGEAWDSAKECAGDLLECGLGAARTAKSIFDDPLGAAGALWGAITKPVEDELAQGNYGRAIGRSLWAAVEIVGGGGLVAKLPKLGKLGGKADPGDVPNNAANAPRLHDQLTKEQVESMLNPDGSLRPEVVPGSKRIIDGREIGNPGVVSALTSDGSRIEDWGKYSAPSVPHPVTGERREIHYYYNPVTEKFSYDMDYKTKLPENRYKEK